MFLGKFEEYKGYIGSIEYSREDNLFYGRLLGIKDFVNYSASNDVELMLEYHVAVDSYIDFKADSYLNKNLFDEV